MVTVMAMRTVGNDWYYFSIIFNLKFVVDGSIDNKEQTCFQKICLPGARIENLFLVENKKKETRKNFSGDPTAK